MRRSLPVVVLLLVSLSVAAPLRAAELTFDQAQPVVNGVAVQQSYGDRISAMREGTFSYRGTRGLAPHVTVAYGPADAAPAVWTTGYGALTNVLFKASESAPALEVTLTADPGWMVVLHKLDLAAFAADLGNFPVTIAALQVVDARGAMLFESRGQTVAATGRTLVSFDPPLQGFVLTIRLDLSNLLGVPGGSRGGLNGSDAIGIDNIQFGEKGPIPFADGEPIAAAAGATRIALADVDGDGDRDLLTAAYGDAFGAGGLHWTENLGPEATFGTQRTIEPGYGATAIAAGDLDGDGDLDAIAAWESGAKIAWYRNVRPGFADPGTGELVIATVLAPSSVALADLDKDGDLDVLTTSRLSGSVQWHANDRTPANGGWIDHEITSLASGARNAVAADLDRDGDLDVLAASESGPVLSWYENLGRGNFGSPSGNQRIVANTARGGRWVAAADVDGDGDDDAVLASCDDNTIAWYPNEIGTPAGGFGGAVLISSFVGCPETVFAADLDLDDHPDLLATGRDGVVRLFRNLDGKGRFSDGLPLQAGAAGGTDAAAADLDRDGDMDIAAALAGEVERFENRTNHSSAVFWTQDYFKPGQYTELAIADVDRDGDGDLIAAQYSTFLGTDFVIEIDENDGTGTFPTLSSIAVNGLKEIAAADLDGDGDPDIVAADGGLSWFSNLDGAGNFTGAKLAIAAAGPGEVFRTLAVADLDRDGDLDVVAGGRSGTGALLAWFVSDGTPADGGWIRRNLSVTFEQVLDVAVADLNRDGISDLVATAGSDFDPGYSNGVNFQPGGCNTCAILWFTGATLPPPFRFVARPPIPTFMGLDAIAVMDGAKPLSVVASTDVGTSSYLGDSRQEDGDPDLVAATDAGALFHENRLGEPEAAFAPARSIDIGMGFGSWDAPAEGMGTSLLIADVNRDGRSDVILTQRFDAGFQFLGRRFDGNTNFPGWVVNEPRRAGVVDLDGDGRLDIVTTDEGGDFWAQDPVPGVARGLNHGGQYVGSAQAASGQTSDGELKTLFRYGFGLNASPGDPSARFESFAVRFARTTGEPLTNVEANALIRELRVYRTGKFGGSNAFDPATDILVAVIPDLDLDPDGILGVALPAGDPNLLVAAGTSFYLVGEIAPGAGAQPLHEFDAYSVPGTRLLKDGIVGSPLRWQRGYVAEPAAGVRTRTFVAPPVNSFADGSDPTPADSVCDAGGGACTLRARVQMANANSKATEIRLGPGVFTLGLAGAGEDNAATGDLDVRRSMVIIGAGADRTIIDGGALDRVFDVFSATLELRDLTVRNGRVTIDDSSDGAGGGIRNYGGYLHLYNCIVRDNSATYGGGVGALAWETWILGSQLTDNVALRRGGGIVNGVVDSFDSWGGRLEVGTSTIARNLAADSAGIFNAGDLNIFDSTISGNQATASAFGTGAGGGLGNYGGAWVHRSTVTENSAGMGGGVREIDGFLSLENSILAGNHAAESDPDCSGTLTSTSFTLIQDVSGCSGWGDPSNLIGVDPLLGPLQSNGGPTPTHALLEDSPAIDAGSSCGIGANTDQRGVIRADLPDVPNRLGAEGCDLGAYEVSLANSLPAIDVPVRWCVLEGSPSFDFGSPDVQGQINAVLQERIGQTTDNIYQPQSGIRFRSAATAAAPNFPILHDTGTAVGAPGDVVVDPPARDYAEFLQIIADCRAAWQALDPTVVGITAVNINRFVDPSGNPLDILGMGGRADFGNRTQQLDAGRVMVVDRVYRRAPYANPEDFVERVLGHELGHAAGSLRHGDGLDNPGPYPQCANGILDDDDDQCEEVPRFDGGNLMQYRTGTLLTPAQVTVAREHIARTIPDVQVDVTASGAADAGSPDTEFLNVLDWEFLNVLDWEFLNVLDWEFLNVLDWEFLNVLDFEEKEVLDWEFLNVLDFGMNFSVTDAQTGDGETTVYATVAGLPWPTPIRPPTTYFWYLDLDEDPAAPGSGDRTGARPADFGFPGGRADDHGVDVVVMLELFSRCDFTTNVCSDYAVETAFAYDAAAARYVPRLGPQPALDSVQPVTVGLVQVGTDVERDDQVLEMVLAPTLPNALLMEAVPGYRPGDPVAIEVVTAIPCGATLPDGTIVDCQCTDCAVCPSYPGCDTPAATPEAFKVCADGATPCRTDAECPAGQACGGGKRCNLGGNSCTSNEDCAAGDFCGGAALLAVEEPQAALAFEAPVLPSCVVDPSVATTRSVTVIARDFPTGTGSAMTVRLGDVAIGTAAAPAFDPATGEVRIGALIPRGTPSGEVRLAVSLEGSATTAECGVTLSLAPSEPAALEPIVGPIEPRQAGTPVAVSARFTDEPGDPHAAVWDWGDGTTSAGAVLEQTGADPGTISGSHVYTRAGVYTLKLSVTDGIDNLSEEMFRFIVVYDPTAGFVTGGGHIDSPPGSYAAQPALVGKGQFGFVARYQAGSSVPQGNVDFELKIARLRFKATAFDWLVVLGHVAQFKGTGTINGSGSYDFLVTAIDEALTPALNMDAFRIQIWDRNDGNRLVFDNRMNADVFGDAATAIGSGSVVVHAQ